MIPTLRPRPRAAVLLATLGIVFLGADSRAGAKVEPKMLPAPAAADFKGTQWAFLVAIDEYPEARILSGKGAVAASKGIASILAQRYGFERSRIIELYDREATSTRINEELRRLGSEISRTDSLFVLLSVASVDPAKESTVYLVPHDVKLDAPWTLIPVPQFAALLIDLPADPLLAIFEGCASRWEFPLRQTRGEAGPEQKSSAATIYNPARAVAKRELLSTCGRAALSTRESLATAVLRWLQQPATPFEPRRAVELQKALSDPSRSVDVTPYGHGPGFAFVPRIRESEDLSLITDRQRPSEERREAIERLPRLPATIADPTAAVVTLSQVTDSDAEPLPLRQQAALALGQIRTQASADALVRLAMKDSAPELSLTAVRALGALTPALAIPALESVLTGSQPAVAGAALRNLVSLNSRDSLPKIAVLLKDTHDSEVRLACLDAIRALGVERVDVTAKLTALALDESDPRVAAAALSVLSLTKADGRAGFFRERLAGANSPIVRRAAAYAVGDELPADPAVAALLSALSDDDAGVRAATVFTLGKGRVQLAHDPLVAALNDAASIVRTAAAEALGKLGNPASIAPLRAVLRSETPEERSAAAAALGRLGAVEAFSDLVRLAKSDESSLVRAEANSSLKVMLKATGFKGANVDPALQASTELQASALSWLALTGDPAWLPRFKAALPNDDKEVRAAALAGIAAIGSDPAVEILAVEVRHTEGARRDQAITALTAIRSPKALDAVLSLVEPPTADPALIEALGGFDDQRAIDSAKAFAASKDLRQRVAAANALQRQALALHEKGQTQRAIEIGEMAFDIRKQFYGENHPEVAVDLNNLGVMYLALNQLEPAQERLAKSLEIRSQAKRQDAGVATTLGNLGAIAVRRGDYKDALLRYGQALRIRQYVLGSDADETLSTLNGIADVYEKMGDRKLAAEYRQQAASKRKPTEPPPPAAAD